MDPSAADIDPVAGGAGRYRAGGRFRSLIGLPIFDPIAIIGVNRKNIMIMPIYSDQGYSASGAGGIRDADGCDLESAVALP
jgi:hypothetical protein